MAANPKDFSDDDEEDGEVVDLEETVLDDVEDTDDGGAIVAVDEETPDPVDEEDFYRNIADDIEETDLEAIAIELIQKIDYDKDSRKERDAQQALAIRRTGLGDDAPGGADFEGASRVVHPMLTKATVEFESRAIGELMPPEGPVKDYIPGESTKARVEKARRKKTYMNWQFKQQMPEFRAELEQLLTQLPLGGSQYMRLVYDHRKKRPVPIFVPVDDVYLPFAASSFYSAERQTYVEHITKFEYENRVDSGQYRDIDSIETGPSTAQVPEQTDSEKATEKIEGKSSSAYNIDGLRDIYEVSTYAELEDDLGFAPYLISICAHSHKVLAVIRNWEQDDDKKEMMFWMAEFGFVPWRGVYHIGLGHMIGWISAAATGALRALLDSAHINNLPTLLKLKGTNFTGQSISLAATQITEIEGGIATDDIRKLIMPIPFNPPSTVLVELLGLLVKEGDDAAKTALDNLSDANVANMPVGTTMAVVEQGLKVLAAIHMRLHASMDMVIKILHRINKLYVTTEEIKDETGEVMALRKDFQAPLDVIPVSDPQIFSDVQRFAQIQMVAARAAGNPLYDQRKVEELILERTKIPNAKELLIPEPKAEEMNAVNENVAASLGRPIAAFPEQDHLAHIQTHMDFLQSEYFGYLAVIAPNFVPTILSHLREHIVLWYVNEAFEVTEDLLIKSGSKMKLDQIMKERDPGVRADLDKFLAAASPGLIQRGSKVFAKLPGIVAKAMEVAKAYAPPPVDPALAVAQIQERIEDKKIAGRQQDTQAKEQGSMQRAAIKEQASEARDQRQEEGEIARAQFKEQNANARNTEDNETGERMNQQDNLTAMTIASAEIEEDGNTRLETGGGVNPNPQR
jgi:hypothetical protein